MSFTFDATVGRRLISDPVKAGKILMDAELDNFQAVRLKYWWGVPNVLDHSGISTGKTQVILVFGFLRLLLLPLYGKDGGRVVAVYFPSQGTVETEVLPRVENYIKNCDRFRQQIKRQHGGKFYKELRNTFWIETVDGGRFEFPAGNFLKDAETAASRRFNDLICDETPIIDTMGEGIDNQLNQRATKRCFNPDHPIHANHRIYLGHAESPDHPYHKRLKDFKKAIRKGSQNHVIFTSSYEDFSEKFYKYKREPELQAANDALRLDPAVHAQIYHGLWKKGTIGLYHETLRDSIIRPSMRPHLRRMDDETMYYLGWDTSSGDGDTNDLNAGVVTAATPIPYIPDMLPGYITDGERAWFVRAVFAILIAPGADVDQKSGLIHLLNLRFGFSGIMLDNRGGGTEVSQKMRESRQFINGEWREVVGLCREHEQGVWPQASPIVNVFDRGDPLIRPWFGEKFISDNSGPIDYAHREMTSLMRRGNIAWTPKLSELPTGDLNLLSQEEREAMLDLEKCLAQFGNIGLRMNAKKQIAYSEKGFRQFSNKGKKDGAMASIYSALGLRAKLLKPDGRGAEVKAGKSFGVYS